MRPHPSDKTVFHCRRPRVRVKRRQLAASLRALQACLAATVFSLLGTVVHNLPHLRQVNGKLPVGSFVALLAGAVVALLWTFAVCLIQVRTAPSTHMGKAVLDCAAGTTLIALAVRSFQAIYTPVCGGVFASDVCYTIPDLCAMAKEGNPALRTFPCQLAQLTWSTWLGVVAGMLFIWSTRISLVLRRGGARHAGASIKGDAENGLRTSLIGADFEADGAHTQAGLWAAEPPVAGSEEPHEVEKEEEEEEQEGAEHSDLDEDDPRHYM